MREVGPSLRQSSRLAYLDAWKGWAIIAVVIIHASVTALQFPRGSINYEFGLITRQFLTFAVPFFFAVSGYFSGRHSFTSFSDALPFWRSRFLRLVPPYIVWTGIYLIALSPRDVLGFGIIKDLLFGTGIGVGYFIIVLLQFVILTPFIVFISSKRFQLPLMFGITGAALLLNYIIRVGYSNSVVAQFPYYVILFPIWYLFFALGVGLGRQGNEFLNGLLKGRRIWVGVGVGLVLSILEAQLWSLLGNVEMAASQNKASSYVYALGVIVLVLLGGGAGGWGKLMVRIGTYSYPIFLMHMLVLKAVRPFFENAAILNVQVIYLPILAIVTLTICVGTTWILCKLLPPAVTRVVLGV